MHHVDAVVDPHSQNHRGHERVDVVEPEAEQLHQTQHHDHAADQLGQRDHGQPQAAEIHQQQHEHDHQAQAERFLRFDGEDAAQFSPDHVGPGDDDARVVQGQILHQSRRRIALPSRVGKGHVRNDAHIVVGLAHVAPHQVPQTTVFQILHADRPFRGQELRHPREEVVERLAAETALVHRTQEGIADAIRVERPHLIRRQHGQHFPLLGLRR